MIKQSIAVLGLGKYGRSLAESLYEMGAEVLVADKNEDIVKEFTNKATVAVCADLSNEDEVLALDLKNMDIVIAAMGRSIAASIMTVAVAKEQGVKLVVAKTSSDRMSSILKKVGADKILDPEYEGGRRSAHILSSSLLDYMELDDNFCIVELKAKKNWVGKNLIELDLRKNYNMNVVAIKEQGGNWSFASPSKKVKESNIFLVALEKKDLKKFK